MATISFFGPVSDLGATIVRIEYFDQANVNPDFAGGPLWTGYVDTEANHLTIGSWQELPLHGNEFWIPRNIETNPLVWPARDASGSLFDVPDTFNGEIDGTFAFISELHLREMLWEKPIFDYDPLPENPPIFLGTVEVEYTLDTGDVWPGWGGYALQENVPGVGIVKAFKTAGYDETIMPALPVQPPGSTFPTYSASSDATITAEIVDLEVYPVPEARQWLCLLAVVATAIELRRLSTRRARLGS